MLKLFYFIFLLCTLSSCSKLDVQWSSLRPGPWDLRALSGNSQVTLNWGAVTGANSYNIYWSVASPVTKASTKISNATDGYIHTGLENIHTYYYAVASVDNLGEGILSPEKRAMPMPAATHLNAAIGNAKITLSWTQTRGPTSYKLYWNTTGGVSTSDNYIDGITASPYIHRSLINNSAYFYAIAPMYGDLEGPLSTEVSNIASSKAFISIPQNSVGFTGLPSSVITVVKVFNGVLYLGTQQGLAISNDGGISFQTRTVTNGLASNIINDVIFADNILYVASHEGVSISVNSGTSFTNLTWNTSTQGRPICLAYQNSKLFIGSSSNGIFITSNLGLTYTNKTTLNLLPSNEISTFLVTSHHLYVGTSAGLAFSTNDGDNFSTSSAYDISAIYATDSMLYVATANTLYSSTSFTFNNIAATFTLGGTISSVIVDGHTIFVGRSAGLMISTDGGSTFDTYTTANGLGSNNINSLFLSGSILYVATDNGLSQSVDGGQSYTNTLSTNGLIQNSIHGIYASGNNLYIGTSGGLSISTDGGKTFTNKTVSDGLGSNVVNDVMAEGDNIYLATGSSSAGGVSISTDNGSTFTNKTTTNGLRSNKVYGIYKDPTNNNLFASTSEIAGIAGALASYCKSTDGGNLFTCVNAGAFTLANRIFATGIRVYVSVDGKLQYSLDSGDNYIGTITSTTGSRAGYGSGSNTVNSSYYFNNETYVATGSSTAGGLSVYRNADALWHQLISSNATYSFAVNSDGTQIYAATHLGLYISTNSGTSFELYGSAYGLPEAKIRKVFVDNDSIYVGLTDQALGTAGATYFGGLYKASLSELLP